MYILFSSHSGTMLLETHEVPLGEKPEGTDAVRGWHVHCGGEPAHKLRGGHLGASNRASGRRAVGVGLQLSTSRPTQRPAGARPHPDCIASPKGPASHFVISVDAEGNRSIQRLVG